jgi:hypothetical protein
MIYELFDKLPVEIAFKVLTWRPHETAKMIKKAFPNVVHNFYCIRPSQMKVSLLTKFLKMKLLLRELGYCIDDFSKDVIARPYAYADADDNFYDYFFAWTIDEYISEGFYIMDENRKPPRVNVGHSRDSKYESDDESDDE